MPTKKLPKKRGAPPKVAGGLPEVLYVRVPAELIRRLDAKVERERAASPGRAISRADVARSILFSGTEDLDHE